MKRLLMTVGGGVLLIAAGLAMMFAVGVRVGEHNVGDTILADTGMPKPPAGAAVRPPTTPPNFAGRIDSFSNRTLTVTTATGQRKAVVDDDSRLMRVEGASAAEDDLRSGVFVAVWGASLDGNSGTLRAEALLLVVPR